ncbi:hypothetical protein A3B84_00590 [Candidatus Nomurabacteria bacterium RIFCSPHIGHO2_02_FULL_35_13]|uniref:Uncharacterized protein n=1 Tax=Candidatus Nomurabacteria bacterium RIFCSPHIGHO2_02_FULL_35_13 TaxID=1801748 RepID=A0A1F6VP48_9BACT|nr:MAG: hypothetical protein A3B84_00590 [Candidatus Nomurabacteria bacterium RIFCSPHIGHO2_02_FULL_35_13]
MKRFTFPLPLIYIILLIAIFIAFNISPSENVDQYHLTNQRLSLLVHDMAEKDGRWVAEGFGFGPDSMTAFHNATVRSAKLLEEFFEASGYEIHTEQIKTRTVETENNIYRAYVVISALKK